MKLGVSPSTLEIRPVVCMPQHSSSIAYMNWITDMPSSSQGTGVMLMNPVTFVQTFHCPTDSNPIKTWQICMETKGHPCPTHVAWTASMKP